MLSLFFDHFKFDMFFAFQTKRIRIELSWAGFYSPLSSKEYAVTKYLHI